MKSCTVYGQYAIRINHKFLTSAIFVTAQQGGGGFLPHQQRLAAHRQAHYLSNICMRNYLKGTIASISADRFTDWNQPRGRHGELPLKAVISFHYSYCHISQQNLKEGAEYGRVLHTCIMAAYNFIRRGSEYEFQWGHFKETAAFCSVSVGWMHDWNQLSSGGCCLNLTRARPRSEVRMRKLHFNRQHRHRFQGK